MIEIAAIVASTHVIEKYEGRFRLTRADLEELVDRYRTGVQMNFGHDPLKPGLAQVQSAFVEPTPDGEWQLVVRFLVDESAWRSFEADAKAKGVTSPGMSYSRTIDFAVLGSGDPDVLIAADAATYSQPEILAAARLLPSEINVVAAEYVEFALFDEIVNVLVLWQQHPEVQNLEWATFGGLLHPALQKLHRAGAKIRYRIQVRRSNNTTVDVVSEIDSAEQLQTYLDQIVDLEHRVSELESELWEWKNGSWIRRLLRK